MHPYCLKIISPKSSKTKLTSLLYPSLIKTTVCQQWQIFIQASEGTRHGRVSKETDTMATWMSLASLSGAHLWMLSVGQRNGPRTTFAMSHNEFVTPSFLNWIPFLPAHPCSDLDLTWLLLAFAGTARGGERQCLPSVDYDCTRHLHYRLPFCHC